MIGWLRSRLSNHQTVEFKPIVIHAPPPPNCFFAQTTTKHKVGQTVEWKSGKFATVRSVAKHPVDGYWLVLKGTK